MCYAYQRANRNADVKRMRNRGTTIGGTNHWPICWRSIRMVVVSSYPMGRIVESGSLLGTDAISSLERCVSLSSRRAVLGGPSSVLALSLAGNPLSSCRICTVEGTEKRRPKRRKVVTAYRFGRVRTSIARQPHRRTKYRSDGSGDAIAWAISRARGGWHPGERPGGQFRTVFAW